MAYPALNNVLRMIALVILSGVAVYLGFLYASNDGNDLREKISRLSFGSLFFPVCLSMLSYLFRFLRWRLILNQLGYKISAKSDFIYYLSGFALTMTPGKSGETIRSAFLLEAEVPVKSSLSAFIIERFFDLLIVGLLASLFFVSPLITLALFLVALLTITFIGARLGHIERQANRIKRPAIVQRLLKVLSEASTAIGAKSVVIYALLGCAAWSAQGVGFYCIVGLFNQNIGLSSAISTYCAGLFAGAASLIPGGLGVTEGSLSWLLQTQGLDQNSALLAALISRGCTLWLAVAIGCIALTAIIRGYTVYKVVKD